MNDEKEQALGLSVRDLRQQRGIQRVPGIREDIPLVPDDQAKAHGYVRVIDESGQDYAYAADRFHPIELPNAVEKTLLAVAHREN